MEHTFKHFAQYHFRGQHDNEKILSVIHRHWFNIAIHYMTIFFIIILQIISIIMLSTLSQLASQEISLSLFFFIHTIILMFLWLYGFLVWIDYWLDVWIVTDQRIINIEQKGLFARRVSELHFHSVQDITSKVQGIIPTLFNYGDVEVQTAAEDHHFLFRNVPNPYQVRAMLIDKQKEVVV